MVFILDFNIHFATLYLNNDACSRSIIRHERRENEKKPSDRIGQKSVREKSPLEMFSLFSAKIFFLQKTWHYLSTWDAPHIWLQHEVHPLADMKAAISDSIYYLFFF